MCTRVKVAHLCVVHTDLLRLESDLGVFEETEIRCQLRTCSFVSCLARELHMLYLSRSAGTKKRRRSCTMLLWILKVYRNVERWALGKLVVHEWLIHTVMALHFTLWFERFGVMVGSHQDPLLSWFAMNVVSSEERSSLPSELVYADDYILMVPTMEEPESTEGRKLYNLFRRALFLAS